MMGGRRGARSLAALGVAVAALAAPSGAVAGDWNALVDGEQAFLQQQHDRTQQFINDEQAFLASETNKTQQFTDDEQAFLATEWTATNKFIDDEQAFLTGIGCTGTCFNVQPFLDDEQRFWNGEHAAFQKFIDDEQSFAGSETAATHQFIDDEQAFLAAEWAATNKFIDDEQAFWIDDDGDLGSPVILLTPFTNTTKLTEPLSASTFSATAIDHSDVGAGGIYTRGEAPTAHCEPQGPQTNVHYDRDRNGWFYTGGVGLRCTGTKTTTCYSELWRRRDMGYWTDDDPGNGTSCIALAAHGFYTKRTKHFTKGAVRMVAAAGVWEAGENNTLDGWHCNGWATNVLDCVKTSSDVS